MLLTIFIAITSHTFSHYRVEELKANPKKSHPYQNSVCHILGLLQCAIVLIWHGCFLMKLYSLVQHAMVIAFAFFELLTEKQQEGVKLPTPD